MLRRATCSAQHGGPDLRSLKIKAASARNVTTPLSAVAFFAIDLTWQSEHPLPGTFSPDAPPHFWGPRRSGKSYHAARCCRPRAASQRSAPSRSHDDSARAAARGRNTRRLQLMQTLASVHRSDHEQLISSTAGSQSALALSITRSCFTQRWQPCTFTRGTAAASCE